MIRESALYMISGLISPALQYITLPILTRNLSVSQFGAISLLESISILSIVFITCAIERAAQRYFYDENIDVSAVSTNCLIWIFTSGFVITLCSAVMEEWGSFVSPFVPYSIPLMIFTGFCSGISNLSFVLFQVQKKAMQYCLFNILKGLFQVALLYYFIQANGLEISGYISATIITNIILAAIALLCLPRFRFKSVSLSLIKQMLIFSTPLIPTIIGAWILNMQGRFFLTKYASLEEVGIYTLWYKISILYFLCSSAINTAVAPSIFQAFASGECARDIVRRWVQPLIKIYAVAGVVLMLVSQELAKLMGISSFNIPPYLVALLIMGHFLSSVMGCSTNLILAYFKKTKLQMVAFLLGGGVSTILCFLLTPSIKIAGVIVANFCSLIFIFICHYFFLERQKSISIQLLLQISTWSILIFLSGVFVSYTRMLPLEVWQAIQIVTLIFSLLFSLFMLNRVRVSSIERI